MSNFYFYVRGIVQLFGKHTYLLSHQKSDVWIDTTTQDLASGRSS